MKQIQLTQGKIALIDDADFDLVSQKKWWAISFNNGSLFYAACKISGKRVTMHRFLLGIRDRNIIVDHADGNGLNNTRNNLRTCTNSQNVMNSKTPFTNTSGYRCVSWCKPAKKWIAKININKKAVYLGSFADKKDAAAVYNEAAKIHYGEFARLNDV